ncbi:papain family cysteine protease domain-containing protein [Ditylenchus destructor]|uniref:Papain family cysteine protease domain-containing protein n=1 Tax=Ditylenchus destructor TaxID=166010 RepID=A0AAD4R0M3_9BILA|nr:papain family cysteine protease domain-containing protein [Ditylenchus destructor]
MKTLQQNVQKCPFLRLVTGSNYTNKQGCKPYPFAPCEWWNSTKTHYPPCGTKSYPTPKCEKKCQASYNKTYNEDKFYGRNFYRLDNDTQAIQKELYTNGPIEVAFYVYSDFVHYKSGIYFPAKTIGTGVAYNFRNHRRYGFRKSGKSWIWPWANFQSALGSGRVIRQSRRLGETRRLVPVSQTNNAYSGIYGFRKSEKSRIWPGHRSPVAPPFWACDTSINSSR